MFSDNFESWKIASAGFGIFGFILSFIIGLFGDVAFGIVVLRAFMFCALFAGISVLLFMLIDKFIPELFEAAERSDDESGSAVIIEDDSSDDEAQAVGTGSNLDITIEDDEEIQSAEEMLDESDGYQTVKTESDDDTIEEMETVEELDEAESEESAAEGKKKAEEPSGRNGKDNSSGLPDIGEYSDSFEALESAGVSEGLSSIDSSDGPASADILGSSHDTQEIVKAVKTVLKKDQEG